MLKTYDYECPICGYVREKYVEERAKDEASGCPQKGCLGVLARVEISGTQGLGYWQDRRYRMKGIMTDGTKREGTFGETPMNPKLRSL